MLNRIIDAYRIITIAIVTVSLLPLHVLASSDTQAATLLIVPQSQQELVSSAYILPAMPTASQTNTVFVLGISPVEQKQQATLMQTTQDAQTGALLPAQERFTTTRKSILSCLKKALADLDKNNTPIKTIIFGNSQNIVATTQSVDQKTITPWLTDASQPAALPNAQSLTLPDFAALLQSLGRTFHTIAITGAACTLEAAYELHAITDYLVTTDDANTENQQRIREQAQLYFQKNKNMDLLYQDPDFITFLINLILEMFGFDIFNDQDSNQECYEFESSAAESSSESMHSESYYNVSDEAAFDFDETSPDLVYMTRAYLGASYNCVDCKKAALIAHNLKQLIDQLFGSYATQSSTRSKKTLYPMTGLDQMSLKLLGTHFFNLLDGARDAITNNHINVALLCALIAQSTELRIQELQPKKTHLLLRNIYMKNKQIVPRLQAIQKTANDLQMLITQAAPNGSLSTFIPFDSTIDNSDFPTNALRDAAQLDKLYMFIQIHRAVYLESQQ